MTLEVRATIERGDLRVDAELRAGADETVALLGPNGAGKTTVVMCLAGLLPPTEGRVTLDDVVLDDATAGTHVPPEERPVGVVFQEGLLLPHLTALENAAFPLRAAGVRRTGARDRAQELLNRVGFPTERAAARPAELSGGEAQRVALVRALVGEPRLLLLDEPTSALDVRARAAIRPLIRSALRSFSGIRVLVTHDPVEAMSTADRVVVMEDGRVTQAGAPRDLRDAPRTAYVAELVGVNLYEGRLERTDGGAGRLTTAEGAVVVAWPERARGGEEGVLGILRPADVALHSRRPEGGSARNALPGRIASISIEGDRARVRVTSEPPVVAEITVGSVERLGLAEGSAVWASFKAVEVDVRLPAGPDAV